MKPSQYIPRYIITLVFLFFVYHETGVFTVLTLVLVTVGIEINSYVSTKHSERLLNYMTEMDKFAVTITDKLMNRGRKK